MTTFADLTAGLPPFEGFASITRLSRQIIITEKIDGTNASVTVLEDGRVIAGSRNRYVFDPKDHFGFPGWVAEHIDELRTLGVGRHFGEWWGAGIQRRYGLGASGEKRFSLFNVSRWSDEADARPACCHVVPTLYRGVFDTAAIQRCVDALVDGGSVAAPGFMKPEGVVVFHVPSGSLFKFTLDNNDGHKGADITAGNGGSGE